SDVVLGDRGDLARVVRKVAVRKTVNRQLRELRGDAGPGGESGRERLDDLVLGAAELGIGDVAVADGTDLLQDLGDRVRGVGGDKLAARRERPGRLSAVEAGTGAIGPSFPLAEVEIQAIEAATQDQVHHRDGKIVRALALDTDQADPDRRL